MNNTMKSEEDVLAILERTMRAVADHAPDMEFSTRSNSSRWMASAAAAALVVAGVGAAGIALSSRNDPTGVTLGAGADATAPSETAEPITSTTMSTGDGGTSSVTTIQVAPSTPTRAADGRDTAWRAAVTDELARWQSNLAVADYIVGSPEFFTGDTPSDLFVGHVITTLTLNGQVVDGNIVFTLSAYPANFDTTTPGWQRKTAQAETDGTPVGANSMMFLEQSNGVTRRVSVVTPTHLLVINTELINDQSLPADGLAAMAQDLNKLADDILAAH
ncbi:MAG: hypothetical protein WCI22_14330 [Actinomycetota bacterium]